MPAEMHHDDKHDAAAVASREEHADANRADIIEAIRAEHQMSFIEAVKLYPKAIGWSAFVSIGVIMLAFDPQLVGNLYATPQFKRDYGYLYKGEVGLPYLHPNDLGPS